MSNPVLFKSQRQELILHSQQSMANWLKHVEENDYLNKLLSNL
jgi:hypothetical protein